MVDVMVSGNVDATRMDVVTRDFLTHCTQAARDSGMLMEGIVFAFNPVRAGDTSGVALNITAAAFATLRSLANNTVPAVQGRFTLDSPSGVVSDNDTFAILNAINVTDPSFPRPWTVGFCFCGALLREATIAWKALPSNVPSVQAMFQVALINASQAAQGTYLQPLPTTAAF